MNRTTVRPRSLALVRRTMAGEVQRAGYVRNCEHCGTDLYPAHPKPLGCFMLADPLWEVASLGGQIKCLCLTCTERVLGSRLPSFVFRTDDMAPPFMLTAELRNRLDPATDGEFLMSIDGERVVIAQRVFANAEAVAG